MNRFDLRDAKAVENLRLSIGVVARFHVIDCSSEIGGQIAIRDNGGSLYSLKIENVWTDNLLECSPIAPVGGRISMRDSLDRVSVYCAAKNGKFYPTLAEILSQMPAQILKAEKVCYVELTADEGQFVHWRSDDKEPNNSLFEKYLRFQARTYSAIA